MNEQFPVEASESEPTQEPAQDVLAAAAEQSLNDAEARRQEALRNLGQSTVGLITENGAVATDKEALDIIARRSW